jgi:hypothetical protein
MRRASLAALLTIPALLHAQGPDSAWTAVDAAMGRAGVMQPGRTPVQFPRGDLRVTAAGVTIAPALALGGWVAMKSVPAGVLAMGDLVLTEDELNPVLARLQQGGIEQTAVHHHLLHETPRVYYVHVHAHGDPVAIAGTIRAAVALTGAPPPASPAAAGVMKLDSAAVARALGYGGRLNGAVLQVSVPRVETIRQGDTEIPPSMGLGTVINFQPTGEPMPPSQRFVMVAEVNPVIKALRDGGIERPRSTTISSTKLHASFHAFWANDVRSAWPGPARRSGLTNSGRPPSIGRLSTCCATTIARGG